MPLYNPPVASEDGGGGITALEDPGNVWGADTAVALGYRISAVNGEYTEVFEVETAGTTGEALGEPQFFPSDPNDWRTWWGTPGGQTFDNDVVWRHLGRVGEPPVAPADEQLRELTGGLGRTQVHPGFIEVISANPFASGINKLLELKRYEAAGAVATVLVINQNGDGDWTFFEGGVFAFQLGDGSVRFDEDGIAILGTASALRSQVMKTGEIYMPTLPTADPNAVGQLWNDGGILKISAG